MRPSVYDLALTGNLSFVNPVLPTNFLPGPGMDSISNCLFPIGLLYWIIIPLLMFIPRRIT